jgi:hypothetical protein
MIEDITIKELAALASAFKSTSQPETLFWKVGRNYFIRTVTHHHTGECVAIGQQEIILKRAAWIALDGRFANALKESAFEEVEPFPSDAEVLIGRASIIDAVEIKTIPTSQK